MFSHQFDITSCYSVHRSFSNAAFKGKTQQHPEFGNSSSLAVDGDLNTRSELGPDSNPWWQVDLGRDGLVTGVRLALNVTSYGDDPGIVIITVANETGDGGECASIDEDVVNEALVNHVLMYCDVSLLGRYIQVEMVVANICSIATCQFSMFLYEVEVMLGKNMLNKDKLCSKTHVALTVGEIQNLL